MAHEHARGAAAYNRAFGLGVALNVGFVVVEVVFGLLAGSLALLADAGHNLMSNVSKSVSLLYNSIHRHPVFVPLELDCTAIPRDVVESTVEQLTIGGVTMALARWDPVRDMMSLRDAMDRLFEESFVRPLPGWSRRMERALGFPADMYETDDDLIINAALPGVKPEDVDISIRDNVLTIKGEYKSKDEGERGDVHFRERQYGRFQRAIALPTHVDAEATEASFEEGILKMTLPKAEEAKPKQIPVKTNS